MCVREEASRQDGNLAILCGVHTVGNLHLPTFIAYLWLPDAAHLIMCVYQVRLNSPGQESYHTRVCIGGEHPAWRWMKSDDAVTFSQRAALLGNCCPRKFKRVLQDWHLPNWDNINLSFYFIFLLRAK